MAKNIYKQFAGKVTDAIKKDAILNELQSKEQSAYIKNAIAIYKSAILVEQLKKAEGLDLNNLSQQEKAELGEVLPIYNATVKAMQQANKVLGNNAIKPQEKGMEL